MFLNITVDEGGEITCRSVDVGLCLGDGQFGKELFENFDRLLVLRLNLRLAVRAGDIHSGSHDNRLARLVGVRSGRTREKRGRRRGLPASRLRAVTEKVLEKEKRSGDAVYSTPNRKREPGKRKRKGEGSA